MRQTTIVLFLSLVVVSEALGQMRQRVLAELDQLPNAWRGLGLQARIGNGNTSAFTVGAEVTLHFRAERDCYIAMAHVDSHGRVALLTPRFGASDNRLQAGHKAGDASASTSLTVVISPPLGRERVYVVATQRPVDTQQIDTTVQLAARQPEAETVAVDLARRFREAVRGSGSAWAVATLNYRVLGRSQEVEYTSKDIIDYFTRRSKSLYRPSLDAHIRFDFNKATLDDTARQALDVWGEALQDKAMQGAVFVIGGHTDDVGPEAYNLDLPRRRAEAVRAYLTQKFRLDPQRFSIKAYGESKPLEPGQSPAARTENRRVEFEMAGF
jgi:outer membrane protein OmpA-like peptidoglycan-associated protein